MTDYRRCELCGALITVEGKPDFIGDPYPITLHYQPACDALVRKLAWHDVEDDWAVSDMNVLVGWAQHLVEEMDNDRQRAD